jgi:hypothetical protein
MPDTLAPVPNAPVPNAPLSTLPGAAVLLAVRRLLIWALVAAWVYGGIGTASKGYCPGGVAGDGGYVDAQGRATDVAPQCVTLALEPSGLIFALIAVIVLSAITRVVRRAPDESHGIRTLDRAILAIIVIVVVWAVVTQVSFAQIPVTGWDGVGPFHLPYTFGVVDVDVAPMEG